MEECIGALNELKTSPFIYEVIAIGIILTSEKKEIYQDLMTELFIKLFKKHILQIKHFQEGYYLE